MGFVAIYVRDVGNQAKAKSQNKQSDNHSGTPIISKNNQKLLKTTLNNHKTMENDLMGGAR